MRVNPAGHLLHNPVIMMLCDELLNTTGTLVLFSLQKITFICTLNNPDKRGKILSTTPHVDGKYTNIDCIDENSEQNDAYSPGVNSKNQMCGSHLETARATFFFI